ncbi:MAG: polyprenyl synthetase family protein, partial [Oscillospiraceae bacterium]
MNKIDINTLLQTYSNECENYIDSILPTIFTGQEIIINSIRYSLFAGGKRIRPSLVYEFCSACEKDYKIANPLAAAVEMIHTYSLIHDDLPCMDNDDFRRGKPSNHKVFGETLALLAGDGLLNIAFETALKNTTQINEKNLLRAIKCLSNYSGICGMIGGQIIDLESENKKIDENTLNNIHNLKTAALIKASCEMG